MLLKYARKWAVINMTKKVRSVGHQQYGHDGKIIHFINKLSLCLKVTEIYQMHYP